MAFCQNADNTKWFAPESQYFACCVVAKIEPGSGAVSKHAYWSPRVVIDSCDERSLAGFKAQNIRYGGIDCRHLAYPVTGSEIVDGAGWQTFM